MKKILSIIGQCIAWSLLIAAVACLGLATDNPALMVPLYGGSFVMILAILVFLLARKKRNTFEDLELPKYIPMTGGVILLVATILFPTFSIYTFRGEIASFGTMLALTFLLLGLGFGGVSLINTIGMKKKLFYALGLLVLIFTATIPAIMIAPIDASMGTLGVMYFTTFIMAVLGWFAFTILRGVVQSFRQ
jgi:hypothetical protein